MPTRMLLSPTKSYINKCCFSSCFRLTILLSVHDLPRRNILLPNSSRLQHRSNSPKHSRSMAHNIVQTVPNEILEIIFDGCCDTNIFRVVDANLMSSLGEIPALALSSVCSRWRRVGLSSSKIWSRISLGLDWNKFPSEADRLSTTLTTFISRSQQQPLALYIRIRYIGHPRALDMLCKPISILFREYER
ncbi:hypothetical protein BDP27DRAFT_904433 [Rhodocollybia butyracea]|uniref:F-box domain-containing protein n=1 Tax=Rhodocollybia butyracea TaxID=206335 RepID=A0A9P5U769_9AGAR|nr:hypothetical protein BDP27DRAFT_904433 [Rhodocollybia butyracea]